MATRTKKAPNRVSAQLNGKESTEPQGRQVTIPAPRMEVARFRIRGDAPYVQNKFSQEARDKMRADQEAGSVTRKGKKREPKDFDAGYRGSMHISMDGWYGFPASTIRAAMVSACRLVGFKMTIAKLSVFVLHDGIEEDGTPLIRITKGEPRRVDSYVRNDNGSADIRPRAMFDPGWEATISIRYDADQFTASDVANLLLRVGMQVGIGAGRPDSKNSTGLGWGTFEIVSGDA